MKTKNEIRNTTAEARRDPTAIFDMGMFGGTGRAIEASERRGQGELVRSEVLPLEMSTKDRDALVSFGVVFGDPVDGDDLFVHATLPAGWEKRPTEHAMWSDLVDDRGRKRGSIFYKAAFYDRKAHIRLNCRHRVEVDYPEPGTAEDESSSTRCRAMVDDEVLFDSGWLLPPPDRAWENPARTAAEAWLDANRPGWQDPANYWDDDADGSES